ncbi:MAG: glycosyltransferase family 39 protein [Candidatus Shapirobacteria bacterium]
MSFKYKVIFLVILATFTRFINLDWGNNLFFHPDENNMATSLSQLSESNLNPHFFAYGQFPLYLGYFSLRALNLANNFINSVFILRFYSALFSLLSLYFFYKIYPHLTYILLLIFTPGLIQLAHFGTTESLLILTFVINLYITKLILKKPNRWYFFLASISTGIAIATKISGAIFALPIIFAALLTHSWYLIPYGFLSLSLGVLLSPYNLLTFHDFISTMHYETGVAIGTIPVFYTTQFSNSTPYFFQLVNIFPYVNGWPIILFACLSIPFLTIKNKKYAFIIFLSCLIYFLYFGQLYVKWTRFMSPLFFIFPLFATIFLRRYPKLLPIALISGILFLANYFLPDTRLLASKYLVSSLPKNSSVLTESGNVVDIPVLPHELNLISYDFYNYDYISLSKKLPNVEYIIIPSRRVFKNYNFNYYQHLFDGSLGFKKENIIRPWSDFFLNSENAEETWSVFDRPTIRVYKKDINLSPNQYEKLLQE